VNRGGAAGPPGPYVLEHRRLDEMLGGLLAAIEGGAVGEARAAAAAFDEALRRHTASEEDRLYPEPSGPKLVLREGERDEERLFRELRLEHVQIRELSGMIVRLLGEKEKIEPARRLLPNLLRRWDAHTAREEREAFGIPES
jgi:Hemerythrin HHE cation binding domain